MKKELMERLINECDMCAEIKEAVEKYMKLKGVSEEEAFEKVNACVGDFRGAPSCEELLEVVLDEESEK